MAIALPVARCENPACHLPFEAGQAILCEVVADSHGNSSML